MSLLIDGYNLLNCAGIVVSEPGRYTLEASRIAVAQFLRAVLSVDQLRMTTLVFDGHDAPKGLPHQIELLGIDVQFSRRGEEADDLLERLIKQHTSPRTLTVVSSDHRVQRAARRRRARAIDSELWFDEVRAAKRRAGDVRLSKSDKPTLETDVLDLEEWIKRCAELDATPDADFPSELTAEQEPSIDEVFSEEYLRALQDDIDRQVDS